MVCLANSFSVIGQRKANATKHKKLIANKNEKTYIKKITPFPLAL